MAADLKLLPSTSLSTKELCRIELINALLIIIYVHVRIGSSGCYKFHDLIGSNQVSMALRKFTTWNTSFGYLGQHVTKQHMLKSK